MDTEDTNTLTHTLSYNEVMEYFHVSNRDKRTHYLEEMEVPHRFDGQGRRIATVRTLS